MATRRKGSLDLGNAIELAQKLPLDARTMVRTKEELLDPESFPTNGYNGMIVACREEQKLYMLIDQNNPTLEASWKVIAPYDDSALDTRVTALENASPGEQVQANWNETDTTSKAFIQNKPSLASVATSGDFNDLINRPVVPPAYDDTAIRAELANKANSADLAPVATSGSYNDLGDKPTIPEAYNDTAIQAALAGKADASSLANVATSGSYNDLGDKPTIPEAYDDTALAGRVTAVETALPGKADSSSLATVATSGSYNDLIDQPTIPEAYDDTALAARVSANETALTDRYTKAETDGKIAEALDDVNVEHFHAVTVLPAVADAQENHEYVVVTYEQDGVTIASEEHYLFYDGVFHSRPTKISLDGYATEQYVTNALPTIDSAMSDTSENPVQNKVVLAAIGDAVDVVDTAVQGLDTRVTALEASDHVELTQAQYDALTTEEKNNGKVYFVTDGQGGSGGGGGDSNIYIIDTANPPSSDEARLAFAQKRSVYIKHIEDYETRFYECLYVYDTEGDTFRAYTIAVPQMFANRIVMRNFWFKHETDNYNVPMVFDRYTDAPVGDGMDVSSTQNTKNGSVSFDDGFGNRFSMGRYDGTNGMIRVIFNKTQSGVQVPVINNLITEDYLGSLVSPNGTKYKLKVADDGTLSTEVVS